MVFCYSHMSRLVDYRILFSSLKNKEKSVRTLTKLVRSTIYIMREKTNNTAKQYVYYHVLMLESHRQKLSMCIYICVRIYIYTHIHLLMYGAVSEWTNLT